MNLKRSLNKSLYGKIHDMFALNRELFPEHLREFVNFVNPYNFGTDAWPRLQCFGAALCFFTNSLDEYFEIETYTKSIIEPRDEDGIGIMPFILAKCFEETIDPQHGDLVVFYWNNRHFHAGILWEKRDSDLIVCKDNVGNLPLHLKTVAEVEKDVEEEFKDLFTMRYFKYKFENKPLFDALTTD